MQTTLTDERIRAMTGAGHWRNESLLAYLDRWARERPERTAFVDGRGRYTWQALARAVERAALGLRAHGLEPGGVLSCQLPNWNEAAVLFLAALRLGAIVNPIPPTYRASELRFMLGLLGSQVAVVPAQFRGFDHAGMLTALQPELPRLRSVLVARGVGPAGTRPLEALLQEPWEARAGSAPLPGTDPNAVHEVVFTSGTTGEPKGVMHTENTTLSLLPRAIERLELSDRDVMLMASTVGHQTGFLFGYCLTVLLGGTTVWMDVWNVEAGARLIEAEGVTVSMGATPFLRDLTYAEPRPARGPGGRTLRLFIAAGAPIPRALVRDARERLGCVVSAGWGMTENGLCTCNGLRDPDEKIFGSDGVPLPGVELRIVDDADRDVAPGVEGHLLSRGCSHFVGYYERPGFTAEAHTRDGWFRTGDRATRDRDGYLTITGRAKDIIIRGGENIPIVEVENLLYTHPKIAGVAIVAMPDPRLGERACAVVVPREGQAITLAEIVAFLEGHQLARQKFPERLELVSEFPTTPSGKVQKYRLRELVIKRMENTA
ncbi:MAG TPA: AMP-binding protein [Methylomirabilota bacterium]|nr:AMP-binding protein [Methylomirabilota bacterium]